MKRMIVFVVLAAVLVPGALLAQEELTLRTVAAAVVTLTQRLNAQGDRASANEQLLVRQQVEIGEMADRLAALETAVASAPVELATATPQAGPECAETQKWSTRPPREKTNSSLAFCRLLSLW